MADSTKNVFSWLDEVRERPRMFALDVSGLFDQIWGYYIALDFHGIAEDVPSMGRHFRQWLTDKTGWNDVKNWATNIEERWDDINDQFTAFFRLVDEYRKLTPVMTCTVNISAKHSRTGEHNISGIRGPIENLIRVEIIHYSPQSYFFIRFHYPDKIEDGDFLWSLEKDAKKRVEEELQVKPDEWVCVA